MATDGEERTPRVDAFGFYRDPTGDGLWHWAVRGEQTTLCGKDARSWEFLRPAEWPPRLERCQDCECRAAGDPQQWHPPYKYRWSQENHRLWHIVEIGHPNALCGIFSTDYETSGRIWSARNLFPRHEECVEVYNLENPNPAIPIHQPK